MGYELVSSGGLVDLGSLSQYENYLDEGQRGLLELDLRFPVSQSVAAEVENKLKQAGVAEVKVSAASPLLRISFKKEFPWLAVIAATILAMAVLAVMIVGWRLFKEVVPEGLQPIIGALSGATLLIILGALAWILLGKRR